MPLRRTPKKAAAAKKAPAKKAAAAKHRSGAAADDASVGAPHVTGSAPVAADVEPVAQFAPVLRDPDALDVEPDAELAPVFPTEADEAEAVAQIDAEPAAARSPHQRARAIRDQLAANGSRAARRRSSTAVALVERAPLFPTDAHAGDLRDAIPSISDDDVAAVLHAGYGAFLASLDAREPVLAADQEK